MWFIGDIHGDFDWYLEKGLRRPVDCSVQLGDFGWGFEPVFNRRGKPIKKWSHMRDLAYVPAMPQHRFICGNHDDRVLARTHANYLGDFGFDDGSSIFYVSGGFSKDWRLRRPGVEWWEHEELSARELDEMLGLYERARPRIVVSHEGPLAAVDAMFPPDHSRIPSRTASALARALEVWAPEHWFFGHYHRTKHIVLAGTRFQCVGEFQRVELKGVSWS